MNQSRFNQLVNQFIKTKAAELVCEQLNAKAMLAFDKIILAHQEMSDTEAKLLVKRESDKQISHEINELYKQLAAKPSDADRTAQQHEVYITDKIELLVLRKSYLACELLYLENQLQEQVQTKRALLSGPDFLPFGQAYSNYKKEQALLTKELEEAMAIDRIDLNSERIAIWIQLHLETKFAAKKTFIDDVNHLCKSHYAYNPSYTELIDRIALVVNSTSWEQAKTVDPVILTMRNLIAKRSKMPSDELYQSLQKLAHTTLNKTFINKDKKVTALCSAIAENNVIALQAIATDIALFYDKPAYIKTQASKPVTLELIDDLHKEKKQSQFIELVDYYLLAQAAELVAKEAIAAIAELVEEFNALDAEIERLEQALDYFKTSKKTTEEEITLTQQRLDRNLQEYPEFVKVIAKYEQSIEGSKNFLVLRDWQIEDVVASLHQRKTEHNTLLHQHRAKLSQVHTLSQLTAYYQRQFIQQTVIALRELKQDWQQETIEWLAEQLLKDNLFKGMSATERLNHVMKGNFQYKQTYDSFNHKIASLVNHPHWLSIKQDSGLHKDIEEMAKLLQDHANTNPKECFDLISKKAARLLKSESSFLGKKLHSDARVLYKAIVDQDMLQLDKLLIQFDHLPRQDNSLTLKPN